MKGFGVTYEGLKPGDSTVRAGEERGGFGVTYEGLKPPVWYCAHR